MYKKKKIPNGTQDNAIGFLYWIINLEIVMKWLIIINK